MQANLTTTSLVAEPATVKKLRLRRGFTLEWVSKQVERQKGWGSKVESGKIYLTGENLEKYAHILEVPVELMVRPLPAVSAEGLILRKCQTPQKTVNRLEDEAELRVDVYTAP
ncbi:helix-turn-helix domain-containing protein [Rothia sp. CCM 9417]|uniref:helix-turn-helix domain-containing protein n=1 Tax=Rothia sp. CCM 9417 TaxID=3402657 RepID=UPI003ADED67B